MVPPGVSIKVEKVTDKKFRFIYEKKALDLRPIGKGDTLDGDVFYTTIGSPINKKLVVKVVPITTLEENINLSKIPLMTAERIRELLELNQGFRAIRELLSVSIIVKTPGPNIVLTYAVFYVIDISEGSLHNTVLKSYFANKPLVMDMMSKIEQVSGLNRVLDLNNKDDIALAEIVSDCATRIAKAFEARQISSDYTGNGIVFIMEKADTDLRSLLKAVDTLGDEILLSVIKQIVLSLLFVNTKIGIHMDSHSGNFLISKHKKPKKPIYFQYTHENNTFFVKDVGYSVYICDFCRSILFDYDSDDYISVSFEMYYTQIFQKEWPGNKNMTRDVYLKLLMLLDLGRILFIVSQSLMSSNAETKVTKVVQDVVGRLFDELRNGNSDIYREIDHMYILKKLSKLDVDKFPSEEKIIEKYLV
jgi:serine/threonine protein kinase